jgi:hypothetical protein
VGPGVDIPDLDRLCIFEAVLPEGDDLAAIVVSDFSIAVAIVAVVLGICLRPWFEYRQIGEL